MLLEDLIVILKVAEFRSITAAASSLDMRTATASAAVKRVESTLGADLFIRTTRSLRLSAAGERYLPICEQAITMLEHAKQNLQEDTGNIEGELRIGLASDLGRNVLSPWLNSYMDEHKGITMKLHLSDSNIDFYRDPVDIALRYGSPNDASLYGFKICEVPRLLVASPIYLEKHGTPQTLTDLPKHNGLFYQLHDIIYNEWEFLHSGELVKVRMQGNRAANDGDMVRRWCVNGNGLAVKSSLDMCDDLLNGRAVSLLPEYIVKPTQLWLICPSRQTITPAVRLLRDTLRDHCQEKLKQLVAASIVSADRIK
ncbi:LysR family transcriptional regulator [Alteromonas sp. 1_MG-2023]|uniref:LysR family transcriptional regulator n=1 Tax=Alteromonas sp. 1_MG-2023 TaxID=3062669 RepID=UPI0026E24F6D|nr:LysR family transcriptional regulator [Alteromonas sp. 1_MG-2023]MDO6569234.1 LysR family transcriptional regulator [Alteromonas sp. 1_MG-2023]